MSAPAVATNPSAPRPGLPPQRKKMLKAAGVVTAVVFGVFLVRHFLYVSTDNAQVQANTVMLSAKVGGYITRVTVVDNQKVQAGEVLAEIDPRDYRNPLDATEKELKSIEARYQDAEKNYHRLQELFKSGAVSRQQYDNAEATYREQLARYKSMQAQVAQATLNVEYTQIRAPSAGVVAKRAAEVGMLAAAGTPLFGFVSSEGRWVNANFKETELKDVRVGKQADVEVDALPGRTFTGEVESISPATGATFTLLPPDNATGNFTKVVQRVPVRIRLLNLGPADIDQLRAGLSAVVTVHIH